MDMRNYETITITTLSVKEFHRSNCPHAYTNAVQDMKLKSSS